MLHDLPLTAASLIVTIYGDVVVPRGEVLWMGSLIDVCARFGVNQSLVRTATSRLAAAGRLEGERNGRRSFYRLASSARTEFGEAARLLYTDEVESRRLFILHAPDLPPETAKRHRMARMGGDVWLCPDIGGVPPPVDLALPVTAPLEPGGLERMAAFWDLSDLQTRYAAMLARFGPLAAALEAGHGIAPADALICRVLLVHIYRSALLRDPCLPQAALPEDWLGGKARDLFRTLYLALSPRADEEIARTMLGRDEPLPLSTPHTAARLRALEGSRN